MVTYRPKWQDSRAWRYGATVCLMIVAGLYEQYLMRSSPELIFFKVVAIPMFLLAYYGVEFVCNSDQAYRRWTAQYFERHALGSLVFATFLSVLNYDLSRTFNELITWFAIMLAVFFGLGIFFRTSDRRPAKSE